MAKLLFVKVVTVTVTVTVNVKVVTLFVCCRWWWRWTVVVCGGRGRGRGRGRAAVSLSRCRHSVVGCIVVGVLLCIGFCDIGRMCRCCYRRCDAVTPQSHEVVEVVLSLFELSAGGSMHCCTSPASVSLCLCR